MITIHTPLGPREISAAVAEALGIRPGEHSSALAKVYEARR